MLYKVEIAKGNRQLYQFVSDKFFNPRQIVKYIVTKLSKKYNNYLICILNNDGQIWKYEIYKKGDKTFAKRISYVEHVSDYFKRKAFNNEKTLCLV